MKLFSGLLLLSLVCTVAASQPTGQNATANKENARTEAGIPPRTAAARTLGANIPDTKTVVETIITRKKGAASSTRIQHVHVKTVRASAAFLKQRAAQQAAQRLTPQTTITAKTTHPNYGGPSTTVVNQQNFGSAAVAGQPVIRTLTFASPGTDASLNFATTAGTHFTIQSSSCTATQCTASVSFAPKNPGLLQDSINVTDGSANLIDQTFVYGVGTAPQLEFQFGGRTEYNGFADRPSGVTVGPDGAFYVVDQAKQQENQQVRSSIVRIHFGGNIDTLSLSNVCNPQGIAVDGSGTIYIADPLFNQIVALSAAGVQAVVQTTPLSAPGWVAVDGTGALYISDSGNGRILKLDNQNVETTLLSGLNAPSGLAVDSAGNVFFADAGNAGEIREFVAATGQTQQISTETGLIQSLSVDASGTLYYTTSSDFGVYNPTTGQTENMNSEDAPFAVAVAPSGAIVYSQQRGGTFDILDPSMGNFGLDTERDSTANGTFIIANTGNAPLTISSLSISGTEFLIDPSSQCAAQSPVAAGATCQVNITFTPTAIASYSENITATSNTLNSLSSAPSDIFNVFGSGYGAYDVTTLSYSPDAPALGQTLTLTATVMPNDTSDLPAPTGSVTFFDGGSTLGSADLSGSMAVFTTSTLSQGTHSIYAYYNGDSYNSTSNSYSSDITVGIGSNSSTGHLEVSSSTINLGDSETLTVTFTGTVGPPTGTVIFYDQNGQAGTATLSGSGNSASASITLNNLTGGSHGFYAVFAGDANYAQNDSDTQNVTVTPGSSSTQLNVSSDSPAVNQPLTLTATIVAGTNPPVSGSVTFSDQNGVLSTIAITPTDSGGTASVEVALGTGPHQLTAAYSNDSSYGASTSPIQVVNVAPGTAQLGLAVSAPNIKPGQTEILFLTLGNRTDQTPATGTVTFSDQNGTLGPGTLCECANGNAYTLTTTSLSPGVHNITANYAGDNNYNTGSSSPQIVTVSGAALSSTTTALTVSPASTTAGRPVTLTATVTGSTPPTGSVTFSDQNGSLGSAPLTTGSASSSATLTLSNLAAGSHQITATYNGDGSNATSVSSTQTVTVTLGATATTLSAMPASLNPGQTETLTATVLGGTSPIQTGNVTFSDQNGVLGTVVITATSTGGTATLALTSLSAGPHQITAVYSGDINYASSASATQLVTVTAATSTTLAVSPASSTLGAPETLTATVSSSSSAPGGTVTFADQNGTLGSATLGTGDNSAQATLTLRSLTVGTHRISATYAGNSTYATSTSAAQTVTVGPGITTTTIDSITPANPTAGQTIIFTGSVQGYGTPPLSGVITFYNEAGNVTLGSATITATSTPGLYTGSYTNNTLAAGTYQIHAGYNNDTSYAYSQSATQTLTITAAAAGTTTTTLTAPTTSTYTSPVALTASVRTATGSAVTTGQVIFCLSTAPRCSPELALATAQLNANGSASARFAPGTLGTHTYVATFLPTNTFATSTSLTAAVTVTGTYPTTSTLAATGNPGAYTLTDTVVALGNPSTATVPNGTIVFNDTTANMSVGTSALGSSTLTFAPVQAPGSPISVASGDSPYATASGDFNGDGFADIATANYNGSSVSVLLGNGDGTFQAPIDYPVGSTPFDIKVADVNGDGFADLIAANTGSNTISILLGNGDGTFKPQVAYAASSPYYLAVLDINHDGLPDVVATSQVGTPLISVLINNGNGTFKRAVTYPGGASPNSLVEGDFNGDGFIDLAVCNLTSNSVGVYLNNGDGTFAAPIAYAVGKFPVGISASDFNGDGKVDLAVVNGVDSTVSILFGIGNGTFQTQVVTSVVANPRSVVAADFNGDGKTDIAVAAGNMPAEAIYLGNGDGTFQAGNSVTVSDILEEGGVAADLNGDGLPDLIFPARNGSTVNVLLSILTQTATARLTPVTISAPAGAHAVTASYPGNTSFAASTSAPVSLTSSTLSPTATALTVSPATQTAGSPVTFTSTVTPAAPTETAPPSGSVLLTSGSSILGTITLTNGTGSLSLSTLPASTYAVVGTYSGDTNFAASASSAQPLTITPGTATPVINSRNFGSTTVAGTPTVVSLSFPSLASTAGVTASLSQGSVFSKLPIVCTSTTSTCTVQVTFTPTYPGLATDALTLRDANAKLLAKTYVYGTGTAPQVGFDFSYGGFGYSSTIASPASATFDSGNTLYIADTSVNRVYRVPLTGSAPVALATSNLGKPGGIAVAGDNTLYIADQTANLIRTFDTVTSTQGILATSALLAPTGVAVDGTGAVYVADTGHNRIIKIDNQGTETILAQGLTSPGGLALDAAGNLFYSDPGNGGEITEIPAGGGSSISIGKNLGTVNDLLVEPNGRVYFASSGSLSAILNGVVRTNGYFNPANSPLNYGIAEDRLGNFVITNPKSGSFAVTGRKASGFSINSAVGSTYNCCDLIENTGNSPLTVGTLATSGTSFAAYTGAGQCTAGQVLQPAQTCSVQLAFTPLAVQSYVGTLNFTTNDLNVPNTANSATIYGGGTQIGTTVALAVSPNPAASGQAVTFSASLTFNRGTSTLSPTGTVQFLNAAGAILGTSEVNGSTAQFTTSSLMAGSSTYTAKYIGDTNFTGSNSAAQTLTVVAGPAATTTLTGVSPATGVLGSGATTVTLTGTNFNSGDVVRLNGATIASTYVSATSLTAVIPASFFAQTGTGLLTVFDPASRTTTGSVTFTVANAPQIVFTGPGTSTSGTQPTLTFQLVNPYPVALSGALTLSFTPVASAGINDPAVQFATGGRSLAFNIAANSTTTPTVQLQTGTVAGTVTIALAVTANGVDVTPASVAPVVITIPPAAPTITSMTVTRSGNTLTVAIIGFSNTRETTQATFHFTPVAGGTIDTPDIPLTVTPKFATYYSGAASVTYGSAFTYTQTFTLDQDASIVQNVTVTLANTVGTSAAATTP